MSEMISTRFHPEVRHRPAYPWGKPSVGGIEDGFETPEEVTELIKVLQTHDRDYYAGAEFRVVKVERSVVA